MGQKNLEKDKICALVDHLKNEMNDLLKSIIRINSVNPRIGGPGEKQLAKFLLDYFKSKTPFDVKTYIYEDFDLGNRFNLIATLKGTSGKKNLWVITHLDTVPAGDLSQWKYHPFEPMETNGRIYGRGAEDNGQSIVTSIFSALILEKLDFTPTYNINLCFVSDEETGSEHGLKFLFEKNIFHEDDLIVILDAGSADGGFIEIAEKSVLWLKIEAFGKQTHSSTPYKGQNASKILIHFANELENKLLMKYNEKDSLFPMPISTFEPTMLSTNVNNYNTIPSYAKLYFDARIIPAYNIETIQNFIREIKHKFETENSVKMKISYPLKFQAPLPTLSTHISVKTMVKSLEVMRGINPRIGGAPNYTLASFFRQKGFPAIAWSTIDNTAHEPNEYCYLKNLYNDTGVLTYFISLLS